MKTASLLFLLLAGTAFAATPQEIRQTYINEAAAAQPGFQASAQRGQAMFRKVFANNEDMPSCTSCHTEDPGATGRHAITGKRIAPLSAAANAERFSDPAKVEKWFGRNCREVVGRPCSAGEKADLLTYLGGAR